MPFFLWLRAVEDIIRNNDGCPIQDTDPWMFRYNAGMTPQQAYDNYTEHEEYFHD